MNYLVVTVMPGKAAQRDYRQITVPVLMGPDWCLHFHRVDEAHVLAKVGLQKCVIQNDTIASKILVVSCTLFDSVWRGCMEYIEKRSTGPESLFQIYDRAGGLKIIADHMPEGQRM